MPPKKLILSRKGFDSGSGGCPSPIFPDGTMLSLPIPSQDREQFDDLQHGNVNIPSLVADLTNGRLNGRTRVHLDPDLNFETYRERKSRTDWQQWHGMLGQAGIAQGHLSKQNVDAGDVFLFFGLYRHIEETAQGWRFVHDALNLHVLWGWLQVGQKHRVADIEPDDLTWARHHPHLSGGYRGEQNTVYAASLELDLGNDDARCGVAGWGVFPKFDQHWRSPTPTARACPNGGCHAGSTPTATRHR